MDNFIFDDFLIEDVIYTLKNFSNEIKNWENSDWPQRFKQEDPYMKAAVASLIVTKNGGGRCFSIDNFIKLVEDKKVTEYDGAGDWVDKEGNFLGGIRCSASWLKNFQPEEAEFIMWYPA